MRRSGWERYYRETEDRETERTLGPADASLVAIASQLPAGRALDLACGLSGNALWLARRGWQVTAVDFAIPASAALRFRAEEESLPVYPVVADLRWSALRGEFDLVFVGFWHTVAPERDSLFQQLEDALALHGHLVLVGIARPDFAAPGPGPFEELASPDEVVGALSSLEVVEATVQKRPVCFPDGPFPSEVYTVHAQRGSER